MLPQFVASVLVGIVFLYVPTYPLLRGLGVSRLFSVGMAPLSSIALYEVLCTVYPKLGVDSSWVTLSVPVLTVSIVVYAVARFAVHPRESAFGVAASHPVALGSRSLPFDVVVAAAYILVGVVAGSVFFLGSLDGLSSFAQEFDNIHHLGVTRGYLESGNWSPFNSTLYSSASDEAIAPLTDSAFYPSAWNCIVAMAASATGALVPLSANAVNFLFAFIVYPMSMFVLMRSLFADKPAVVAFGSLVTVGFTAFPWKLFIFGPLYPNLIGFSVLPMLAVCFIVLIAEGVDVRSRVLAAALFVVGVVAAAFMQPNAVFSAAVLLAPYLVYRVASLADRASVRSVAARRALRAGLGIACTLAVIAIWYALFKLPFLQGVVTHWWPATRSFVDAFCSALDLSFRSAVPQLLLAALVVLGGIYTLFHRKYLWISVAYAFACAIYIVDSANDGFFKFLLSGFWYTDSARVAAFAVIFAVPLASMGLAWLAQGARNLASRALPACPPRVLAAACAALIAVVFACVNYFPGDTTQNEPPKRGTAFGEFACVIEDMYTADGVRVYDAEEMDFVNQVKEVVSADDLIVNVPDDGSAFAYSVDGLRVYYRYLRTYNDPEYETADSKVIRERLNDYAYDLEVREAIDDIGATYVLELDQGYPEKWRTYLFTYYDHPEYWDGITHVVDDTPGFDVVLAKDDMRLYRIDPDEVVE